MSESDTSSDTAVVQKQFKCKQCDDGKVFTAAEKDQHRAWHRAQRERPAKQRSTRERMSPVPSEVTLFEPIESPPPASPRAPRRPPSARATRPPPSPRASRPPPPKKRRSIKTFNANVEPKKLISG